jgi:hypothetical protein
MRQCDAVDIQYDIPVAGDYRMWIQNQDGGYMNDWDSALFDGAVGSHQVSWLLPAGGAEKERVRVVIDKYSAAWTVERREYGEWITLTAGPYGFIEPGENVIVEQGRSLTVNYGYDSCNENATYELVLRNGSTEHVLLSGECGSGGYYEGVFKVPYSAEMIGRNVVALNMEDGSGSVSYVKNGIVYIHAEGELNAPIVPYDSDGGGRLLIKPYGRPIEIEVMGTVIRPLLYSVSLYDLRGRCVKEIATAEPYDTKEMASGVYFMRNKRVGVAAKMVVIK